MPTGDITAFGGMEGIEELLKDGLSWNECAQKIGCNRHTLQNYCNATPERTSRTRAAMAASGDRYADRAQEILNEIPNDATNAQVARHRELAHHFRWLAGKRDPKRYGERLDITATVTERPDPAQLDARLGAILGQVIRPELPAPAPATPPSTLVEDAEYTDITHDESQALDSTGADGA